MGAAWSGVLGVGAAARDDRRASRRRGLGDGADIRDGDLGAGARGVPADCRRDSGSIGGAGSLGATLGVLPAALMVTAAGWALVAGLAIVIGRLSRNPGVVERGTSAVKPASLSLGAALAAAGAAAFAFALTASRL